MLHLALTTLLALQTASGSPNVAPAGTAPQAETFPAAPSDAASDARSATPHAPRATRTPGPRTSAAPLPKASADMLVVVNKSDNTVSILDAATGNTVTIEPGIYLPGKFGVRIEDDYAARDAAPPASLSARPGELLILKS